MLLLCFYAVIISNLLYQPTNICTSPKPNFWLCLQVYNNSVCRYKRSVDWLTAGSWLAGLSVEQYCIGLAAQVHKCNWSIKRQKVFVLI